MADRSREGRYTQAEFFHRLVSPLFRYTVPMFQGPQGWRDFVIRGKGCGENVPAMVETLPASWIAVKCPLCSEHRRYLPTEVFRAAYPTRLLGSRGGAHRAGQGKPCSTRTHTCRVRIAQ
jgi:hypothetical protein